MKSEFLVHFRQRQTFYKLVTSFLTMLILPLILVVSNYPYSHSLLREENLNYQDAVLQQVQLAVDERLQELQLHILDISNDALLNGVLQRKLENREEANLDLWRASNQLGNYAAYSSRQCDTVIYSTNYDCLISNAYVDYRVSEGLHRFGPPELNEMLRGKLKSSPHYCKLDLISTAQGEKLLVLLHTMPLWSTGQKPYATIALSINPDSLFSAVSESEELDSGLICLLTPDGSIAAQLGDGSLAEAVTEAIHSERDFLTIGKTSYTVSKRDSRFKDWCFISIHPEHTLVHKLNHARNISLIALSFVLITGIAISYWLAYRNYQPLKRLMAELRHQSMLMRSTPEKPYGEYNLIERSMKEMAYSMSSLETALQEEIPRIQESVLMQLFRNAVTDFDHYRNVLQKIGVVLPFSRFRVALISGLQDTQLDQQFLKKMIFKELIGQLAPSTVPYVFATIDDDNLILLLNGDRDDFDQETRQLLNSAAKKMREDYGQMCWINASEIGTGMESVSRNYYSVTQAQPKSPEGGVHYLTESNEACAIDRALESMVAQMQNYVAVGEEDGAISFLHRSMEADIRQKHATLYETRAYCIGVLNIITGGYRVEDPSVLTVDGQAPLKLLFLMHNLDDMEDLLCRVIRQICTYAKENQQSPATMLASQIIDYIQKEYGNVGLTLTSVATRFDLTPSYLSVFFKNNVGDTFLNYLTRLRMDKAKELMRTTSLSIVEISEKVGYASANSFTRSFKKLEQITPSQYRESVNQGKGAQ